MKLFIDHNPMTAMSGETILDVASRHGMTIPTLCHLKDGVCTPSTSCLVCLVKLNGKFVPACATKAEDGMRIESETDEVKKLRRSSLELLLSDHRGDCHAPCQFGCPARLDIPKMLREIRDGDDAAAIRTIKEVIPLPAVLGRVCPKPCEKICRRNSLAGGEAPGSVKICAMKRYAADVDLARPEPYVPTAAKATGKRVIVMGAGPSGLSAAYYLARLGHSVALYGLGRQAGGRLRKYDPEVLPESVLDAELRTIFALPIDFYPNEPLEWTNPEVFDEIRRSCDAILLCTGPCDATTLRNSGFEMEHDRLRVDTKSFATSIEGVFAAGTIFRAKTTMVVRSVADGREAASSVDRFLCTGHVSPNELLYSVRLGKLTNEEVSAWAATNETESGYTEAARQEAARCLHCDCRGRKKCLLLRHAVEYRADLRRFDDAKQRKFQIDRSGDILFEPGKCIKCGLCVSVAKKYGEEIGLAFSGRGFDVTIVVPFDEPLERALEKSAAEAVQVCPTAALSLRRE